MMSHKNVSRIICAQLNINSLRNKFEQLKSMVFGIIDILVIPETKLNATFPEAQFLIGYIVLKMEAVL